MADDLLTNIKASSKRWATAITQEATKNLGKFSKLIKVKSRTVEQGGKVGIESTGTAVKGKPVARAYEYGSGKRSRSKKRSPRQMADGYIRIAPKRKKVLAFFWDKVSASTPAGKKFLGVSTKTGKALFAYVDHPGVKAANNGKGYLAPAIAKVRRTMINKELPKDVRKAVLGSIKKGFGVSKK